MGEAADRKVIEIEETRARIEEDLRDLETRIPAPLRSAKSLVGIALGSAAASALLVRLLRGDRGPTTEVVIRVVREDA